MTCLRVHALREMAVLLEKDRDGQAREEGRRAGGLPAVAWQS